MARQSKSKYTNFSGCCICGLKNSTSQFRPWFEHYPEETFCRVFKLNSLEGRKGHLCNPCVLFIKRAVHSMENNCLTKNPRKRLDERLKGGRRRFPIIEVLPPKAKKSKRPRSRSKPKQKTQKKLGYVAKNLRVHPKYVMIGQKYLKLKSKFQLIPAGPWQDPKDFLEDESDAEKDIAKYRRVTLKKGRKTLEQKLQKKIEFEAAENRRHFQVLDDDEDDEEKENGEPIAKAMPPRQEPRSTTPPEKTPARTRCVCAGNNRAPKTASRHNGVDAVVKSYGTRSKGKKATVEKSGAKSQYEDPNEETNTGDAKSQYDYEDPNEETDTGDEMIDEEDLPEAEHDKSTFCPEVAPGRKRKLEIKQVVPEVAPRKKRKLEIKKNNATASTFSSAATASTSSSAATASTSSSVATASTSSSAAKASTSSSAATASTSSSAAHRGYHPETSRVTCDSPASSTGWFGPNRRVFKAPVKNFKRPKVSFMDCTYWQKFMLCCFTIYVGEGGVCVLRPHGLKECPLEKKKKQCRQHMMTNSGTKVLKPSVGDSEQSVQSSGSLQGFLSSAGASSSRAADEEWEVESALSSELQHSQGTGAPVTSSQDELMDQDSDASIAALKENGADRYSEAGSFVSSGEDELTDSRMGANTSPMIEEKPCRKFFP